VTDDDRAGRLKRIQQAHGIADQMEDGVLIDRLRSVALALTAHVGRDRTEACRGERIDLVTSFPESRGTAEQEGPRPARRHSG
jgi:hypothetical protein